MVILILSIIIYILSLHSFLVSLYNEGTKLKKYSEAEDKIFFMLAFIPFINSLIVLIAAIVSIVPLIKYITRK